MTHLGFGRHTAAIPPAQRETLAMLEAATRLVYVPTATLVCASWLLFVNRLCPHTWVRAAVVALITTFTLLAGTAVCFTVFQCRPVRYFDLPGSHLESGTCIVDPAHLAVSLPIATAAANLLTWSVPLAMAISVQFLKWHRKVLSTALALLIIVSCGVGGILRLPVLYRMHHRFIDRVNDPLMDAVAVGFFTSYHFPRTSIAAWGLTCIQHRSVAKRFVSERAGAGADGQGAKQSLFVTQSEGVRTVSSPTAAIPAAARPTR